ncbi:hypothetical protein [Adhaeribacter aquaticus]|uniref:hypothetical protein n=1 Tax=Adhaeribacter aquaticus TaxID=299567 RepID=UPI0004160B58|nr:hypothetical protein [Adhaeribacter aquaticus]
MILFDNSLIKLNYSAATDILEVAYPDLHGYLLTEIKNSIDALVENVRNYDVKKLLLDSSNTIISVSEQESREIASYLAAGLIQTRLRKLARIQSPRSAVENTAQNNIKHIKNTGLLPFELLNFSNKAEAIEWLKNQN